MCSRGKKAREYFEKGFNCAQSVFAAFCDETGLDEKTALMISSPFGGGIGRMREVCGAVSGMMMTAGMLYGNTDPDNAEKKKEIYRKARALAAEFKEKNGSIVCKELLGLSKMEENCAPEARTKEYYKKRPCSELVEQAADIMQKFIDEN